MQFTVLATLIAGVAAFTVPVVERTNCPTCPSCPSSSYNPCPGALYAAPVCGALDLLGVACLDVAPLSETPRDARDFKDQCAKKGQRALCATLPILGQGLLCKAAVGTV